MRAEPEARRWQPSACALALLVLSLQPYAASSDPPGPWRGFADLPETPPRRTFARRMANAAGCSLAFELPAPAAVVVAGPVTVRVQVAAAPDGRPDHQTQCRAAVALYHNNARAAVLSEPDINSSKERAAQSTGSQLASHVHLSATLTVEEGAHALHAVLLDEAGAATSTVAYATFLAREQLPSNTPSGDTAARRTTRLKSLQAHAERACREGVVRDDRGGVRTATSPCDALLQLGHELRLAGEWGAAAELLAHVICLSAAAGREGDLAHALHVYPYLELAKCALAAGDAHSARRSLQTIQRLQPGYILPTPHPSPGTASGWRGRHERARGEENVAGPGLIIDAEAVRQSQLRHVWHLVCEWTALEFVGPPGMLSGDTAVGNPGGHYRLLRHIASQFRDALIIEMGTMHGGSAIALASGSKTNSVVTYNIVDDFSPNAAACGMTGDEFRTAIAAADLRVEYRLKNIMASEDEMAQLLKAALIHIDINHHGDIEDAILQYLAGAGYQGLVLLDDIYLNEAMDRVWGSQTVCKYDLTDMGHTVAGTGLLDFSCSALTSVTSPFPP